MLHCKNKLIRCMVCMCCSVLFSGTCIAQGRVSLNTVISTVNTETDKLGIERLYLQTDKPAYSPGDTLWFKAYVLNAATLTASTKSGLMYVEITSDSSRLVKRIMLPLYRGLTYGSITVDGTDVSQGGYTLRAYTNWMRNFGEEYMFKKRFYVSGPTSDDWLLSYNTKATSNAGKDNVRVKLQVNQLDKNPVRVREMQLRLTDGKRTLLRSDVQTDVSGELDVNFDLPEKANAKSMWLTLQDMRKGQGNRKLQMPLALNRPENIDLQFMPEGGNLVAGQPAQVAFKALNEDGLGANIQGKIYNNSNTEVADFASAHKGIGAFNLMPIAGEVYTAKIKLPNGTFKSYPLPAVAAKGIALRVNNSYQADSCRVTIGGTPDSTIIGRSYYLIGQSRGVVCYGASFRLGPSGTRLAISKDVFPTGVVRFMVVDVNKTVLNERIMFNDHADNFNIKVSTPKTSYSRRDSVSLALEVTDKEGKPVSGSFSLAVTDNGQVKVDSLTQINIATHLLLSSNLQGTIEDIGYYANPGTNAQKWQHTDQLLLAQGWVGYNWNNYFKPPATFAYQPEQQFEIRGKVTNAFNKPVANSGITLFSKKPFIVTDTVSNDKGIFRFSGLYPADTAVYFLQARNKRGKSFNVGIEMEEFAPPVFKAPTAPIVPWYVNIDTTSLRSVNKRKQLKDEQDRVTKGTLLKAVEVKAKKVIKGSKNLNGNGGSDIIIDEQELEKAGRTNLRQLLEKRVKGFYLKTFKGFNREYVVNTMILHLIIDGVEIDWFYDSQSMERFRYYDQYLDYYDAEEIKGIEVMTSTKYSLSYVSQFIIPKNPMADISSHCFVEVTTRSGHGPFVKKSVGTYVYRPMPFAVPKSFYAPRYKANAIPDMTDIRSTIYWAPNIVTDKDGKATISFYTADNAGTYTVQVEGADLRGGLGAKTSTIKVNQ